MRKCSRSYLGVRGQPQALQPGGSTGKRGLSSAAREMRTAAYPLRGHHHPALAGGV